ncbi:MAG TPA: VOC family protein, partial [Thermomicrobiaceae bacterium]|nr:VOC family protein [Thermomicrobiaceae bacterium]
MSDPLAVRPGTALRVADLAHSLAFYLELPGMTLVDHAPERDLARLDAAGYPVLLAGPRAPADLSGRLATGGDVLAPGGTLHVLGVDLDALGERLTSAGVAFARVERPWGDRAVRLTDPDGYRVSFEAPARGSPEETIRQYEAGPRLLEEAVAGLDAAGLDTHREPNGWTIRQIAHHLADVEALTYPALLAALAEPGREWLGNPW